MKRSIGIFASLLIVAMSCERSRTDKASTAAASRGVDRFQLVRKVRTTSVGPKKMVLRSGFGVSVVEQRRQGGEWIGLTSSGLIVRMSDLTPAKATTFAGVSPSAGKLDFAWVTRDGAAVFASPAPTAKIRYRKPRLTRVRLLSRDGPEGYLQTRSGWMRTTALAVPSPTERPADVDQDERWIDVHLATQVLVAYVGDRPVFATLVSAGVGAAGTTFATPLGTHRIAAKLRVATMDNLEHPRAADPYFYEEVPFTQYFGRVALHGAYWHDRFGQPMSHGCINMSLADAEHLFDFTKPTLARSAKEIAAGPNEGTVLRVR